MKRITNEQILDTIYDLADTAGMKIDAFIEKIEEAFGDPMPSLEGVPEEIAQELLAARESKKETRKQSRKQKSDAEASAEIKRFRELFPDVNAEDIPEEVWDDVASGSTLSHAYALYTVSQDSLKRYADNVNSRNSHKGAAASSDGSTEPVFTKEQVEKMSGKDVKSNYKGILKAMKSWRYN